MYYLWRITALDRLKMNLKREWLSILLHVNLFIELVERKTEKLNPSVFFGNSESYFEKMLLLKSDLEKFIKPHHIIKKKKKEKNL